MFPVYSCRTPSCCYGYHSVMSKFWAWLLYSAHIWNNNLEKSLLNVIIGSQTLHCMYMTSDPFDSQNWGFSSLLRFYVKIIYLLPILIHLWIKSHLVCELISNLLYQGILNFIRGTERLKFTNCDYFYYGQSGGM